MELKNQPNKPQKSNPNPYLKYSSLGVEMVATFLLCAWLGRQADAYFQTSRPWATIALLLLAVVASMTLLIKQINK